MIKRSIQEEDITFTNINALNTGALKYIKQMLTDIKGEIDNNRIIVEDFNILITLWTDHSDRKSIRQCGLK